MLGVIALLFIGVGARLASGVVERPRFVPITRMRALAGLMIDMVGGAASMVLVVIEAVPRTTVTEIVAVLIAVYLVGGRRHKLIWGPINPAAGAFGIFNLHLESSGDDAVPVEFGPISAANVQHAGQAGSAALADLGVPAEAPLKIRYAGAMDQKIVARIKRRP